MKTRAQEVQALYGEVHADLSVLPTTYPDSTLSELASQLFALRELAKWGKAIEADAERASKVLKAAVALRWVRECPTGETIRCPEGTASPFIKTGSTTPSKKKNPEKYAAMLTELGVPQNLQDNEVVRIHWPGWVEHLTELTRQGLPLPDCVDADSTYEIHEIVLRSTPST